MDKTSPQLTDWTKAQIIIKFTTDTGVVISYDFNFSFKSPVSSNKDKDFLSYSMVHHEGDYFSQKFSTPAWTNFTLEMKVVSSNPTISAYKLFNGASNITGKMRINDTSLNGSHNLNTDIILDRNDTALVVEKGTSETDLTIDNNEWNLLLISISNNGDKC